MGKGEGHGEGYGEGHGDGEEGRAAATAVGATGAICLIVCFCVFGIPALIAGAILIAIGGSLTTPGIVVIVISLLFLILGILCLVLMCVGIIGGKKNQTDPQPGPTVAVINTGYGQPGYGQPGYGQPGPGQPYPPGPAEQPPPPAYANPPEPAPPGTVNQ